MRKSPTQGRQAPSPGRKAPGGQRRIPDEPTRSMFRNGATSREVADRLVELGYERFSRQALQSFKTRYVPEAVGPVRTPTHADLLPWVLPEKDRNHRFAQALRFAARVREGLPLTAHNQGRLDAFLRELGEVGGVAYYDRVNGWRIVAPRPGVDTDLIYDPRLDDSGRPIPDWHKSQQGPAAMKAEAQELQAEGKSALAIARRMKLTVREVEELLTD